MTTAMATPLPLPAPLAPLRSRSRSRRRETGPKLLLQQSELNMIPPHVKPVFMADAISVTNEPRLVIDTQRPHAVVHANRAWSRLTGGRVADVADRGFEEVMARIVVREGRKDAVRELMRCVHRHGRGSMRPLLRDAAGGPPRRVRVRVIAVVRPATRLQMDTLKIISYLVTAEETQDDQLERDMDTAAVRADEASDRSRQTPTPSTVSEASDASRSSSGASAGAAPVRPGVPASNESSLSSESDDSVPRDSPKSSIARKRGRPTASDTAPGEASASGPSSRRRKRSRGRVSAPEPKQQPFAKGADLAWPEQVARQVDSLRNLHRGLSEYYSQASGYYDARAMPYADLDRIPGALVLSQCGIIAVNTEESMMQAGAGVSEGLLEPWIVASSDPMENRQVPACLGDYRPPACLTTSDLMSRVANIYAALERQHTQEQSAFSSAMDPTAPAPARAPRATPVDPYLLSAWRTRQDYLRGVVEATPAPVTDSDRYSSSSHRTSSTSACSDSALSGDESSFYGDDDEAYLLSD